MAMKRNAHKFNAVKTVIDGIKFASKAEAHRYSELKMLEKAGRIYGLITQPSFALKVNEEIVGRYVADFQYCVVGKSNGMFGTIEDVKGMKTALYKLKKKMVEAQYGITITEITR